MNKVVLKDVAIEIGAASIHIKEVEVDAVELIALISSFQPEEDTFEPVSFKPFNLKDILKEVKQENPFKEEKHTSSKGWEQKAGEGEQEKPFFHFNPFGDESLGSQGQSPTIADLIELATKGAPLLKDVLGNNKMAMPDVLSLLASIQPKKDK